MLHKASHKLMWSPKIGNFTTGAYTKFCSTNQDEIEKRGGSGNLNIPISVETAPEGEDIARENRSKDDQKTPPHPLSGLQGEGGAGRRSWRQDAGRVGAAARRSPQPDH